MDQELRIEKVFTEKTRRSSDSTPQILRSLLGKKGFDRQAQMAIAMPHDRVFFKTVETDDKELEHISGLEQDANISSTNETLLNDAFPVPPENTVAKMRSSRELPDNGLSILTAAVCNDALNDRADTLRCVGIAPDLVDAPIFAIHTAVALNHPEIALGKNIIACIDGYFLLLAILEAGEILAVRNIPVTSEGIEDTESPQDDIADTLLRETRITWHKLFGEQIDPETNMYISAETDVALETKTIVEEQLNCTAVIVDPYAQMGCPGEKDRNVPICLAEGLALRALAPEESSGTNFLESAPANARPQADLRRDVKICLILLAAVVVASFIGLFTRLSALERENRHVNREIETLFRAALPNEKNIKKPLAQVENELQSLQGANISSGLIGQNRIGPLQILNLITRTNPGPDGIRIADIVIAGESASLTGTSKSFEAVHNWQIKLQQIPQFSSVEIDGDLNKTSGDTVHFKVSISLAAKEKQI
jgi:Tfp pilus assembly PilM family ATPase